ncbi:hypothetical protein F7725_023861 [Dissostichus mawsoni]|uniref:Uncharacterized protein n=1 Tax=Dissostichus mawsoni TaxID=36200 RepID=A0A7J5XXV6_DISMA|nr:hypothetical protein F7725_023861 [Dissostichus mawsoni]
MQRLARYPLEKAKKIMKKMYQASWANSTGRKLRGWTLHSMKRGMKTILRPTRTGSHMLSFPGCRERNTNISHRDRLRLCTDVRDGDSPQAPPFATVVLTSTVTAGNVPMVTVKMKHTDRAITQI